MEKQRDVAFKIMYFFIVFIIATFGLLYTYFKMSQKAEEDAARENAASGMLEGRADFKKRQQTQKDNFFDFLAGQMDNENYSADTNARSNRSMNSNNQSFNSMVYNKPRTQRNRCEGEFGEDLIGEGHDL